MFRSQSEENKFSSEENRFSSQSDYNMCGYVLHFLCCCGNLPMLQVFGGAIHWSLLHEAHNSKHKHSLFLIFISKMWVVCRESRFVGVGYILYQKSHQKNHILYQKSHQKNLIFWKQKSNTLKTKRDQRWQLRRDDTLIEFARKPLLQRIHQPVYAYVYMCIWVCAC